MSALGAVLLAIVGCIETPSQASGDGRFKLQLKGEDRWAQHGSLFVPLRHDDPDGQRITIKYVRVFGENRRVSPFFFLAGGPGGSGTKFVLRKSSRLPPVVNVILKHADIIFIDQRGTGTSRPHPICDDDAKLPLIPAPDRAFMLAEGSRIAENCAKLWRERDVDLQAFNTAESARDLEALRQALRLPSVSLLGASYGTHLAFAYLRRFGTAVDLGILFGIQGPDHTYKLPLQIEELFETIDERSPLGDGRSVKQLARQVRDRLESAPVRVRTDGGTEIEVGVFDFQRFLTNATLRYDVHRRLPPAIAKMAEGDFSELARWRLPTRTLENGRLNAMHSTMKCASGASRARLRAMTEQAPLAIAGGQSNFPLPEACRAWGVEPLPNDFRAPFSSEVPMLLFSGVFDARTPVSNGREMLQWFPKARHVIVSNLGHASCYVEACLDLVEELLTTGGVNRPREIEISPSQEEVDRSFKRKRRAR